jgi:ribosome maturation factor RimP
METDEIREPGSPALDDELEAEFAAIAAGAGCELVHAEWKGGVLRLFIDRPEGVTHAHCERVSKQVSALLDVVDFGAGRYLLEVSSPGLDRQLYRAGDYRRFTGRLVRVTYVPGGGAKRTVVGRLAELRAGGEDGGEVAVIESASEGRLDVPLAAIATARLEIEL